MKPNKWLENFKFLENIDFHDKIYFQILAKEIANYLKNCPIPIITWWNPEHQAIYFLVGQKIRWFVPVDVNVSYKDYITRVEKYAKRNYPQYKLDTIISKSLTEDEIVELLQKDKTISFDDAVKQKRYIPIKEKGIIEKVYMKEDEFILNVNGIRTQRMSGIPIQKPMSISNFLDELRVISSTEEENTNEKIRDFIFDNSVERKKLKLKNETITYTGMQMINFFNINFSLLRDKEFKKTGELNYSWGQYEIKFESPTMEKECVAIYIKKSELANVFN